MELISFVAFKSKAHVCPVLFRRQEAKSG